MHKNNFNFLRLLFAIFVVITHSYTLAGVAENDLLSEITNKQTSLSYIGVRGFFIISGYLIFQSIERSSSLLSYYWKRILRLFPGLVVVLALTIILGFFVYDNNLKSYLSNKTMWSYLSNNLFLFNLQFGISGVFEGGAINGSLWTLRYEFSFYILLSSLYILRNKKKIVKNILSVIFILMLACKYFVLEKLGPFGITLGNSISFNLGCFFVSGALLASIQLEKYKFKYPLLISTFILLIISIYLNLFLYFQYLFLPVIVVLTGISSTKYFQTLTNRIGDISYGIYIYSFPIQVTLMYYFNLNYLQLMWLSMLLSVLFGVLSWNLIEKKALQYKSYQLNPLFRFKRKLNNLLK